MKQLPQLPSAAVQKITANKDTTNLTVSELVVFMNHHGFSDQEFANFFGVTLQGVRLWKKGQRDISLTNTRIIRILIKYPHLMKEF